ncbi:MAG: TonB-dependent receptor, partial [Muribaculaceae bacterium]|nr:TonB-dependent receptor [Muribaculaceae bacterium]
EISYSYDRYDKSRFIDGLRTHEHDYSNRQHIVHGLFTKFWGANGLTVGADYMHDYLCTYQFTENAVHTQTSADAFVQFDYNPLTWFNLIASVRDDYFSASRSNAVTSRIALMFKPNPLSVRASYAGGFRAPSLKEMYMCFDMAGLEMIYGNPDLKPERSHNFNLSLERSGDVRGSFIDGSYNATLTGYFNYYDSRITTTEFFNPEEDGATYINEDGVRVMGFDLNARYRTKSGLGASLSYNYLHIAGRTIDSQFNQPRPHSATWRLDYEKRISKSYKFYVALSGRYLSKPISNYPADGAYSLWKLTFQQTVLKGLNINIVVDNLLNYKPKVYYWNTVPTNGISCSIGLSINID